MRTLFIPCYFDGLPRDSGSAMIRAQWVADHWDGAEVYDRSQRLSGWDVYVFQKAYLVKETQAWIRAVARWRDERKCVLAFDLCDPDFLDEEHEQRMLNVLPLFDFAVGSTEPLVAWLSQWLPAYHIRDRLDLAFVDSIGRVATYTDATGPTVVWAGYAHNWPHVQDVVRGWTRELQLQLDVQAVDTPKPFVEFWRDVLQADVLLNPRVGGDDSPTFYKSDNKTVTAWALGQPVARTFDELRKLCDPIERRREGTSRACEARVNYHVRLSVHEWQQAIADWRTDDE
jgi:hypothetical protein